jgi:chemotaxis protein MotB
MFGFSSRFRGVVGMSMIIGAAALLGGCGASKEEVAAQDEAVQLREQVNTLNQQLREAESKNADQSQQISSLQQQVAAKPVAVPDERGVGTDRPAPRRSGGGERFELGGDILFGSGSATLGAPAKKELDKVIAQIKSRHPSSDVRVEGYSDSQPIKKSKWKSNQELSEARAAAVRQYLVQRGISSSRVESVGYGEDRSTKGGKGRRVEIVVLN